MHLSKMTAAILDDLDYAVDASAVRFKCSREDTTVYIHIYIYIFSISLRQRSKHPQMTVGGLL